MNLGDTFNFFGLKFKAYKQHKGITYCAALGTDQYQILMIDKDLRVLGSSYKIDILPRLELIKND